MAFFLLVFIGPMFVLGGVIGFLVAGICDLVMGLHKTDGKRNKVRIIRGAIFLSMAYLIIAAFIIMILYIRLVPIAFM